MAFLTGLVTGLASSVDDQLKKDMLRTQERVDGMAQYRVTRRRAEQERQQKEEREVEKSLKNLASLVDGDIDKAYQLFVEGGANVEGANEFYKELKLNQRANKDINAIMKFQGISNTGTLRDYVRDFVTPISALPVSEDEASATGLYGALFKPDTGKKVMSQVEEASPLGDQTERALRSTGVDVDYSQFISAEDYARKKEKEEQEDTTFDMSVKGFNKRIEKLDQDIDLAQKNYDLAQDKFENGKKTDADRLTFEKEKFTYDKTIRDKQLDIAVANEARAVAEQPNKVRLSELTIEERELALKKENNPEYKTFEALIVANKQELIKLQNKRHLSPDEKYRIRVLEKSIDMGFAGIDELEADASSLKFSDRNLDSIYKAQFKFEMEAIGLYDSVNDKVKQITDGQKLEYFKGVNNAIINMSNQFTQEQMLDTGLNKYISAQGKTLTSKVDEYIKEQLSSETGKQKFVPAVTKKDGTKTNAKDIQENAKAGLYEKGQIIEYQDGRGGVQYSLYTGQSLI